MKYSKRRQQYENSTKSCIYKPLHGAWSYDWWKFVDFLPNGVIVFNTFNYSTTTSRHQSQVHAMMGTKPTHYIEAPQGLDRPKVAIEHYQGMIRELQAQISKPRSHKRKNVERTEQIEAHKRTIQAIRDLYGVPLEQYEIIKTVVGSQLA